MSLSTSASGLRSLAVHSVSEGHDSKEIDALIGQGLCKVHRG